MNSLRKIFGFLIVALVLAGFAQRANADGRDEKFTLVMAPASVSGGAQTITATLASQVGDDDRIRSFKIPAPAGVTVSSATSPSVSPSNITVTSGLVSVKNVNLNRYSRTIVVTLGVTFPPASCAATPYTWSNVKAWEDTNYSSGPYTLQTTGSQLTTTVASGGCAITATAGPNGSITPSGVTPVSAGGSQAYTIAGSSTIPTYHVADVLVDGVSVGAVTSYTFNNVTANHTISATFAIDTYTIKATSGSNGSVSPDGTTTVNSGGSQTYTIAASTGYYVTDVLVDLSSVGKVASYPFTNVAANHTISASFARMTLSIASPPSSAGVGTAFPVTVGLTPSDATAVVSIGSSTCGASATPVLSSGPSATLSVTIATPPPSGFCSITFVSGDYLPVTLNPLKVFAATVAACSTSNPTDTPPTGAQFSASCAAGGMNVTGFAAGFRGPNKDSTCGSLNFTLTNNICNATVQQDANGNLIPPNTVSFVWDQSSQSAAFTYTVTWKAEYVDPSTGLPFPASTKYCTGTDPNNPCAARQTLKACTSPLVAVGSIPAGEPACSSEEGWEVVKLGDPGGDCSLLNIPGGGSVAPACVRVTTTIIDAKDPPIIRG